MANLTVNEKYQLEAVLQMGAGFVLGFSNASFARFVHGSVGIDVYNGNYEGNGTSKANILRTLWDLEPDAIVGTLLSDLLARTKPEPMVLKSWNRDADTDPRTPELWNACIATAERLKSGAIVADMESLKPNNDDHDFSVLAKSIRESLEKNQPQVAIDRLHTFCMKYVRTLCKNHKIEFSKEESLNALFGKYVKSLERNKQVQSSTAIFILKSTIGTMSHFNDVRKNRSLAHDNPIVSYHEALLISNNIATTIKFIEHIEGSIVTKASNELNDPFDNIPF